MSNTSNASKNVKRFLLLFALGIAYGFMYVMPYMKSSFYDQMIAAMGCTNAQLGSLMTAYCICCTVSYLPGGWIGDKFNPKPVLLISIFGQAALSFLFMFTYKSYAMAVLVWCLMALTGGFAFWPAIMKGIRMTGTDEEQGRMYGIFEALNGLASLLLSFIMIGIMAIAGKGDLVTGFKSALACMGGLSMRTSPASAPKAPTPPSPALTARRSGCAAARWPTGRCPAPSRLPPPTPSATWPRARRSCPASSWPSSARRAPAWARL